MMKYESLCAKVKERYEEPTFPSLKFEEELEIWLDEDIEPASSGEHVGVDERVVAVLHEVAEVDKEPGCVRCASAADQAQKKNSRNSDRRRS